MVHAGMREVLISGESILGKNELIELKVVI